MWQLYTTFRFGDYKTSEIDLTPALGISLIVGVFGLIIRTGSDMKKIAPYLADGARRPVGGCGNPFIIRDGHSQAIVGFDGRLYCYGTACGDDALASKIVLLNCVHGAARFGAQQSSLHG